MARTAILPLRLWQLGIPAFAALVGAIAGLSPQFGIAAALGVAFVVLVLNDLATGLALFVMVAFLEDLSAFGALSLAKLAGALLALSWLATSASQNASDRRSLLRDHPVVMVTLVVLGTWTVISALWSELPGTALGASSRWVLNLVLFPIVYAAVRERRHVRWVFALFVAGALISAAAGLAGGAAGAAGGAGRGGGAAGADGRLGGSGVNANELGELLIVAVVLAAALGSCRDVALPGRMLAFIAAGVAIMALLMTLSRGAMVGLVVALLVAPLVSGPRRRVAATALVVLTGLFAVTYLFTLAPEAAVQRITQSDTSGTGRTDIWKVGLRMVRDKPLIGVGAGNYPNSTIHYLLEPGAIARSDFIVDTPKVAHNIYLQVQAELGIVGLLGFLSIVGYSLVSMLRAARAFARAGDRSMELLSRALVVALCGLLASGFFSSAIYSKQLWLLLALGATLPVLAARPHQLR